MKKMKNLVFLISVLSLISCKKENVNPLNEETVVYLKTKDAALNAPINDLTCQVVQTHHELVSEDKVLSSGVTVNGRTTLSFTHNSWYDYDLEVDAQDKILLNGLMPNINLGESNNIELFYSEKADLQLDLMNTDQGAANGNIWFKITYNDYPEYQKSNSIPTKGVEYYCMPGTMTYEYPEVPAGNYTIEWEINKDGLIETGTDSFSIVVGDTLNYDLAY